MRKTCVGALTNCADGKAARNLPALLAQDPVKIICKSQSTTLQPMLHHGMLPEKGQKNRRTLLHGADALKQLCLGACSA